MSLIRPNLLVSKLIMNCRSESFSVFEITFQDANIEIVNVVAICIEVQWQR